MEHSDRVRLNFLSRVGGFEVKQHEDGDVLLILKKSNEGYENNSLRHCIDDAISLRKKATKRTASAESK